MAGNENSDANEQERTESKQPSTNPSIVGIGASAGGVQALQTFFEALPDRTGVAFVVIVHLAPESHSELPRILATRTRMPVTQVYESASLEPDHVYVIPPDRHLLISDNEISAHQFDSPRGQRAPIDLFFRSLAEQHGDSFAIILTGAGSDGAGGLKAVKEAGGIILVQDPNEAEYASMPRSAIATGLADFVLPLREIAARVVELAQNKAHAPVGQSRDADEEYVRRILAHVCSRTGHDFSQYKKSTVLRRIARRTQVTRREQLADYFAFLRDNVEEVQALFGDLLISVTTFFRDPKAFEALAKHVIPRLFEGKESSDSIRVWVPGCATGEEAYTIAIMLLEEAARHDIRPEVQVFGSDLDAGGLAVAREGRYPIAIEADASEERLRRFFAREGDHYRAKRELRDAILFASHSLLKDPPFSGLDLVSCRNLLIYLDRELQEQVCGIFHYALNPNGFLFLGSSESAESPPGLFRTVDREARIYQSAGRSGDKQLPLPKLLGTPGRTQHAPHVPRDAARAAAADETALHRLALEKEAPPSILVDEVHRTVHLSENAGRFLQPSGGPLTSDVTELVRQELRSDLRAALHQAFERGESTLSLPILVSFNGLPHRVYLQVKPVRQDAGAPARQALVLFIEGGPVEQMPGELAQVPDEKLATSETVRRLREELQQTQAHLRATREDSEITNEELRAGNEELQSINEEYRSTSEELETSKEELQSLNEELQTVNNELKLKFEWVSRAHSDLQNLMASTDVGTLFVDTALRIQLFTPYVADLFNIKPGDEGRPITDFTHQLDYDGLADDARAVLEKFAPVDREIRSLAQSWYLMRLRPYRTVDNTIDGVVVTFVEVTERRNAEEALRQSEERYRTLVEAQPDPICQFLPDTTLTFVNRAYAEFYGREPEALIGRRWLEFAPRNERPRFLDELATFTPEHPERHEETRSTRADRELRWYLWHLYGFFDDAGNILSFQTFGTDITSRKGAEEQLAEQLGLLTAITDSAADAIFVSDGEERVTLMNPAAERLFGWSREELTGRKLHDAIHDRYPDGRPYPLSECPLSRVYATGETLVRHEDVFFRKGGSPVQVACSNAPLVIEGRIAGAVLVAHDITERKRSEAALRESEARYRTAGEAIRYGVWVCNPEGGAEFVSQTFLDLIGKTLDEVKPRGWLDRLPPEDLKPTLEAWHACVRTGCEWTWEHRVKGKDGLYRTILSLGRPVRDDRDRITSWVGFNLDISARKEAEDALRESEARFRGTFENAAVGIANIGMDGAWLRVNQRLCQILGYSRAELLQKNFQEMKHPEDLPSDHDRFTALMRGEIDTYQLEKRYLHKDGHAVWVDLTSAVQRDQAGNPAYCIAIIEDISARKHGEQALRESEARLRRTVENAPFPIMVHAEDGEVVHLSQAWLELTGYSREEIGTIAAWTERAYGERKEMVRADIGQLYALDRALDEGEAVIRAADGRMRIWTSSSAPLGRDGRGRRLVVSMAADITQRKEAERALRESEVRMRALLDASQDEILLLSTEGEVLAINKAAERRLTKRMGWSTPVGAHLDGLLPQDQVEQRMAVVRQVAATATLVHCEVPIRSRWFEFWFYPVLQPDTPGSEVAVYAREITAQKKSQADLSKLFQAIQQSPTSVVITDRDGKIEYVNPEFTDVTGYTLAEAIGRNPRILNSGRMPPEFYADLWGTISAGGVWRGELLNKKKNGELFWELASIAPVKEGDKITNFVAVKEDITERREVEEQLRQSQKMQAVGQLTGGIAHDFNNLLAIVIGNLQLLQERVSGDDDAKVREYLDDALWAARRGGELTHRLLAFARKQPLKPAIIDLNDVVRGMTELLRRTLGANIRIEESLAPDLWKAFADRGELERALLNLAVNTRDAMRSAGTLTLETRNALLDEDYAEQYEEVTPGEYVLFAVSDTGTGMPPEIVERVFEPFFTTKEVGQGSGLGLSMVYGFVKQSGGHVSIYSRVGQGTCVQLYLPRAPSSAVTREEDAPDVFPEDLGNKAVLVVEDEAKLRKLAVKMLDRLGLRSMQAETAKDALELLADTHVDVLFTDIELPGGMSGTELAEVAHQLYPELKVLFTTGYARETTLHEGGLHERAPWLLKPYSHQELARELKALLVPTVH